MANRILKAALLECIVNFDNRVLITDLLNEYNLPYDEVEEAVEEHLKKEEKYGTKFAKRFLIHGFKEDGVKKEIYTVVEGEAKMEKWLKDLHNAEATLYSVEVAGSSNSLPDVLKPVRRCGTVLQNVENRVLPTKLTGDMSSSGIEEPKMATKKPTPEAAKATKSQNTTSTVVATPSKTAETCAKFDIVAEQQKSNDSEEKKKSPTEPLKTVKKPMPIKGSINSFFAPSGGKKDVTKETKKINPTPPSKKMNDFFKKETPLTLPQPFKVKTEKETNKSMQLFDDDCDEIEETAIAVKEKPKPKEEISSDEDEKLEAIKRDVFKMDKNDVVPSRGVGVKRRRILDSDDDDDDDGGDSSEPKQKIDKKDEIMVIDGNENDKAKIDVNEKKLVKSETYLDEDGFVCTIKATKRFTESVKTTTTSPEDKQTVVIKPEKVEKVAKTPTPKTKQGNIMNFFTRK